MEIINQLLESKGIINQLQPLKEIINPLLEFKGIIITIKVQTKAFKVQEIKQIVGVE